MKTKKVYTLAARNYQSVSYAYVWCERLADRDPEMGGGRSIPARLLMRTMYREYAAAAEHMGDVQEAFRAVFSSSFTCAGIIRPVHFDTWYEIFRRVYDRCGGDYDE